MTAAAAAVEGATAHMRAQVVGLAGQPEVTARELAGALFDALLAAQTAIIAADGTLTTLCCALAFPVVSPSGSTTPSHR